MTLKTKECQELIHGLLEGRYTGKEMLEEKRRREDEQISIPFCHIVTAEEGKEVYHVSQVCTGR